jgi:hypothetical protein
VEENLKRILKCLGEVCEKSAVDSRAGLRWTPPFRESRISTACDPKSSRPSREAIYVKKFNMKVNMSTTSLFKMWAESDPNFA